MSVDQRRHCVDLGTNAFSDTDRMFKAIAGHGEANSIVALSAESEVVFPEKQLMLWPVKDGMRIPACINATVMLSSWFRSLRPLTPALGPLASTDALIFLESADVPGADLISWSCDAVINLVLRSVRYKVQLDSVTVEKARKRMFVAIAQLVLRSPIALSTEMVFT